MAQDPFEHAATGTTSVSSAPTAADWRWDATFKTLCLIGAAGIVALVVLFVFLIGDNALPAMNTHGLGFLTGTTWNVSTGEFGILPEIFGTIYSSFLALIIAGAFGIAMAIFLTQDFLPAWLARIFRLIVEMLAAIPSVVFGLWGIYVVIPAIRPVANFLHEYLGFLPIFGTSLSGPGMAPAVIVLAIMVLPTVSAISQDAFNLIPYKVKEAAYGMGATKWEAIFKVFLPTAASGIAGALVLGFGRALGETMALAMLIGGSNQISWSLFSPANTLASLLASNFPEAGGIEVQALMYAALALLGITLIVNILGVALMALTAKQEAV